MLRSLQIGRGLAASAVVAYHLNTSGRIGGLAGALANRGYLGVDFFFVLSGFIILFAHHGDIGRPQAWFDYAKKRFVRIYPIYWLLTAGFIALALSGLGSRNVPATIPDWITDIVLLRLSSFQTTIPPAWTLCHEIVFYAAFSVLIFNRRIGLALMAAWMGSTAALFFYPPHSGPTPFGTIFGAYNLNFLTGMLAFLVFPKLPREGAACFIVAGILAFAALLYADLSGHWATYLRPGYGLSAALVIAGAAQVERLRGGIHYPAAFLLIGDASYSIYLLHESIGDRLAKVLTLAGIPQALLFPAAVLGTISLGCLGYLLLEKPLLNWARSAVVRRRPLPQPA